jgi:nucleotide-binding universal stress UspA family protein
MFEKLLVGVDGRPGGRDAIVLAQRLAAPSTRIVLAHVYTDPALGFGDGVALADERDRAQRLLTGERLAIGVNAETVVSNYGSPGRGLHYLARTEHADGLVIGCSHRGSIGRLLIGDDTRAALHGAPCAVAVAPRGYARSDHEWQRIGVADDGSPDSRRALEAARGLAVGGSCQIVARSVVTLQPAADDGAPVSWTEPTEQAILAERERLAAVDDVVGDVAYGEPQAQLVEFAREVDVLVVGSRGLGPIDRALVGSISTHLAGRVSCPLLVLGPKVSWPAPGGPDEPSRGPRGLAEPAS